MAALLAADLHLTSSPSEAERWGIFDWFHRQIIDHECRELFILGDGTEAKDRHDAQLVNRMSDSVSKLLMIEGLSIYWLRGNHDGLDPQTPFFKFLGQLPGFFFVTTSMSITCSLGNVILLPNTANWEEDWEGLDMRDYDYAMAHQTFSGAISETGYLLEKGIPPTTLDFVRYKAYSGDIHTPQTFGKKGEYVGAPYRTRFGDRYDGRCLLVDNPKARQEALPGQRVARRLPGHSQEDLHFPTKGKHVVEISEIEDLDRYKVPEGGHVKVRVKVSRADLPVWTDTKDRVRKEAERRGWTLKDVELVRTDVGSAEKGAVTIRSSVRAPTEVFKEYCSAKQVPELVEHGGLNILIDLGR